MHIKDGSNSVKFEPACVFDEEGQSGSKLKQLRRLLFLLPALLMFIFGFNSEDFLQFLLLILGLVSLVVGTVIIVILTIRKSGGRKVILFVNGCVQALKFNENTDGLQIAWTQKESEEYVKKQIALEQERFKVMKTWQFLVIIAFLVVVTVILVKIGATIGAF